MPLTPLPPSNTKRYKMRYTVGGVGHSITARCSSSQNDTTALGFFNALFAAIAASLGSNTVWTQPEVADEGSDVFNAVGGWSPLTGTGSSVAAVDRPRALCFAGRTVNGRKTKAFLYGMTSGFTTPDTYEEDPIVTATIQDFRDLLQSQADFWLGIDGVKPTWYQRITIKTNDHFVDALR